MPRRGVSLCGRRRPVSLQTRLAEDFMADLADTRPRLIAQGVEEYAEDIETYSRL